MANVSAMFVTVAAALLFVVWIGNEGLVNPKEQMAAQGPYPSLTGFDFEKILR